MRGDALYAASTGPLFTLLRVPTEPPEPPAGSHDSVLVMRASPKFLKYRLVLLALGVAAALLGSLLLVAISLFQGDEGGLIVAFVVVLPLALLGGAIGYLAIRIDYALRYYVLTDRSLRVRSGAFVVREQTLTYANVQNLELHQGPIQRWLGISDLRVETAGGGGASRQGKHQGRDTHAANIAGVENAREIREQIRGWMRRYGGGAGLGDPEEDRATGGAPAAFPSAAALAALREVVGEARGLRAAAEARAE